MRSSIFSQLASDSAVACALTFSQKSWRENYYLLNPGKLCSGLTSFWLNEKLLNRSPLSKLLAPNTELLSHLSTLQSQSYYPAFPDGYKPEKKDLLLLAKKYGSQNWKEIKQCVINEHQGDFILYDFSRFYRYVSAYIEGFNELPETFPGLLPLTPGSAIIAVFRYLKGGKPEGHRIAYYLDQKNQHHFFDPNAGEIIEPSDTRFCQWLKTFITNSRYPMLKPSGDDYFLTIYQLKGIAAQG